jgi:hypothetical protein
MTENAEEIIKTDLGSERFWKTPNTVDSDSPSSETEETTPDQEEPQEDGANGSSTIDS